MDQLDRTQSVGSSRSSASRDSSVVSAIVEGGGRVSSLTDGGGGDQLDRTQSVGSSRSSASGDNSVGSEIVEAGGVPPSVEVTIIRDPSGGPTKYSINYPGYSVQLRHKGIRKMVKNTNIWGRPDFWKMGDGSDFMSGPMGKTYWGCDPQCEDRRRGRIKEFLDEKQSAEIEDFIDLAQRFAGEQGGGKRKKTKRKKTKRKKTKRKKTKRKKTKRKKTKRKKTKRKKTKRKR